MVVKTVSNGMTVPDRMPRMTCITPFLIGIFDSVLSTAAVNGNEFSGRPISVTTEINIIHYSIRKYNEKRKANEVIYNYEFS